MADYGGSDWKKKLDAAEMRAVGSAIRKSPKKPVKKTRSTVKLAPEHVASRQAQIDAARKADEEAIARMLKEKAARR